MASSESLTSGVMKRSAIDPAGRLGSLYDGCRDCVLGQLNVGSTIDKSYQLLKSIECQIIKGDTNKRLNLLRLFQIDEELQLSILLSLTSRTGIASLIDYSQPICELTRILHFQYINGEERFLNNVSEVWQSIQLLTPQTSATHIVTGVEWGLHVVVILQLPSAVESVRKIDDALGKIRLALESKCGNFTLSLDDKNLLGTIIDTKIYSNAPDLTKMSTLYDAYRYIDQFKNGIMNYPTLYVLQSITSLCPGYTGGSITFKSIPSAFADKIVNHLLHLLSTFKNLEISINDNLPKLLSRYLKGQLYDAHRQWLDVRGKYMNEIERFSKLVLSFRHGHIDPMTIKHALEDNEQSMFKKSINELTQNRKSLELKGHLITDLQQFKYCNVTDRDIDGNDAKETIERKLIIDEQHDRILCTDDTLNKQKPDQFNQLRCRLLKEYEENPTLRLIYADFTYSTFQLYDTIILPSPKIDNDKSQQTQTDISSSTIAQSPVPTPDIINILLLGETGVGKSTFINAFANYLTFDAFQTAELSKPIVLIPVSMVMTTGDNFDEHTIELNSMYKSDVENFNPFGQSVTQYCKSYILHLKHENGRKLRIIDTPGFGDTRGIEQDDRNMQHILEYINSLTHLNAICFLLKPNTEKLNISFRSWITQLLDHLGADARENIIFCFTNARATFFTPGNTAPQLKSMLNLLSMGNIPFKKDNTFCFDSESFRYLVALQRNIPLKYLDRSEYENSWLMSTKESNHLIDYICTSLTTYHMEGDRQSIKSMQFEIIHMVRPMLETMRNILRNVLLSNPDSPIDLIALRPKAIHRLATRCLSCKPDPIQVGKFWILPDFPHEIQDKCLSCTCASDQHTPIEYILKYECVTGRLNFSEMNNMLRPLVDASVDFAHFLKHVVHSAADDPFMIGLHRMVEEEKDIYGKVQPNDLNLQLVRLLENIIRDYKRRMDEMRSNQWDNNLPILYNRIKTVAEHSMICKQMAAIKQGQEIKMKQHEYMCS